MRRLRLIFSITALLPLLVCPALQAANNRVIKVLPHFLDLQGRKSISPSLYDRDAYQAYLRQNPEKRAGMEFDIQWKSKGPHFEPLKLRLELRGVAHGAMPKELTLEKEINEGGWFSHWSAIMLDDKQARELGEITAWRVTLLENNQVLSEQRSFLW